MKALLIKQTGEVQLIDLVDNSLESMQKQVGGYIQMLHMAETTHAYVNEDGIALGLSPNPVATKLCRDLDIGLMPGDYIKGNMLIMDSDDDGESVDVSESFIEKIAKLGWVVASLIS